MPMSSVHSGRGIVKQGVVLTGAPALGMLRLYESGDYGNEICSNRSGGGVAPLRLDIHYNGIYLSGDLLRHMH